MDTTIDNNELDLLRQQSLASPEPIAILDEHGEVAFINTVMQLSLPGGKLSAKARAALTGARARRLVTLDRGDGDHRPGRQMLGIPLGHYCLVTLIEREDDPRIERLRKQFEEAPQRSITDSLTGRTAVLQLLPLSL